MYKTVLSVAIASVLGASAFAQTTGPSTSVAPYVLPSDPGVKFQSVLTVKDPSKVTYRPDGVTPYPMVGIPDGLGAFDNGDGTFTVLMNHEIGFTNQTPPQPLGITRDHGGKAAFVSKWVIDKTTLQVVSGDDLIKTLYVWDSNPSSPTYNQFVVGTGALAALNRLCSADLPAVTAFFNPATGLGTESRIFMNGEETTNGRAFAHIVTGPEAGKSWELPWTGKYAWENHVASPYPQNKTVVMGLDDSARTFASEDPARDPSEVFVWVGTKQASGSEIEKAGLRNGTLYGISVGSTGNFDATEATVSSGERFTLVALSDQTNNTTAVALQAESKAKTITQFRRVEDGSFDPNPGKQNDFYFVTTDQFGASGFSKLWRLRFDDITNPEAGGTLEILVDGTGTGSNAAPGETNKPEMFDNITVDAFGGVVLQEDVGNVAHLGKIWRYDIATGKLREIARHDDKLFLSTNAATYIGTQDEETSGVIDAGSILGNGAYLLVDQVHRNITATDPALVELGQLLAMREATAPTITITTPASVQYFLGETVSADYACDDLPGVLNASSGVDTCVGNVANGSAVNTTTVGARTFTVNSKDNFGNASVKSVPYSVVYDWSGFFQPVDNLPVLNQLKAGQAVPVKFSLAGNQGLGIFASGSPSSQAIACTTGAAVDTVEQTVTAGSSGLTYDATTSTYSYVWKTEKSWSGTCRQLKVALDDGTVHTANFSFR